MKCLISVELAEVWGPAERTFNLFFINQRGGGKKVPDMGLHPLMGNSACVSNKKEFPPISQREFWVWQDILCPLCVMAAHLQGEEQKW